MGVLFGHPLRDLGFDGFLGTTLALFKQRGSPRLALRLGVCGRGIGAVAAKMVGIDPGFAQNAARFLVQRGHFNTTFGHFGQTSEKIAIPRNGPCLGQVDDHFPERPQG